MYHTTQSEIYLTTHNYAYFHYANCYATMQNNFMLINYRVAIYINFISQLRSDSSMFRSQKVPKVARCGEPTSMPHSTTVHTALPR